MKLFYELVKDFRLYLKKYLEITFILLGIQGGILACILLLAALFALIERINFFSSIYFSFITAMTIGYGDITPQTAIGRIISVLLGYLGLTFFGIMIGAATEAARRTIQHRLH